MNRIFLGLAGFALLTACVGPSEEERAIALAEAALDAAARDMRSPTPAEEAAARQAEAALIGEAKAFMQSYAEDLRAGDRAALAARYDREGVSLARDGIETELTWSEVERRYAAQWRPPASFEWRDLSFEASGPDSVGVRGAFLWVPSRGGAPVAYSYGAVLVRRDGGLRIRIEDEAELPDSAPSIGP